MTSLFQYSETLSCFTPPLCLDYFLLTLSSDAENEDDLPVYSALLFTNLSLAVSPVAFLAEHNFMLDITHASTHLLRIRDLLISQQGAPMRQLLSSPFAVEIKIPKFHSPNGTCVWPAASLTGPMTVAQVKCSFLR